MTSMVLGGWTGKERSSNIEDVMMLKNDDVFFQQNYLLWGFNT